MSEETQGSITPTTPRLYNILSALIANDTRFKQIILGEGTYGAEKGSIDSRVNALETTGGKVGNKLIAFGKTFDGSKTLTITQDAPLKTTSVSDAEVKLSLTIDGKNESRNAGLVSGGLLYSSLDTLSTTLMGTDVAGQNTIKSAKNEAAAAAAKGNENAGNITIINNALSDYLGANSVKDAFNAVNGKFGTAITGDVTAQSYIDAEILKLSNGQINTNKTDIVTINASLNDIVLNGVTAGSSVMQMVDSKVDAMKGQIQGEAVGIAEGEGIKLSVPQDTPEAEKKITTISVKRSANNSIVLGGEGDNGLKTNIFLKKLGNAENGYAASYQLQIGNTLSETATALGDVINIPKDQFLKNASYANGKISLTFAIIDAKGDQIPQTTEIDVADLINTYEAGSGLVLATDKKTFNIGKDSANDGQYLVINADSIGLSGITEAINSAKTTTKSEAIDAAALDAASKVKTSEQDLIGSPDDEASLATWKADENTPGSLAYLEKTINGLTIQD